MGATGRGSMKCRGPLRTAPPRPWQAGQAPPQTPRKGDAPASPAGTVTIDSGAAPRIRNPLLASPLLRGPFWRPPRKGPLRPWRLGRQNSAVGTARLSGPVHDRQGGNLWNRRMGLATG